MAEKHYKQTSIALDQRDWSLIGKLSQRTHVSRAHFVREALRAVVIKYRGLLADDPTLDLTAYEAAPAHASVLAQNRSPRETIQPHEHLTVPEETMAYKPESEPPPAAVPSDTTPSPPPRMPWSTR